MQMEFTGRRKLAFGHSYAGGVLSRQVPGKEPVISAF
jgi:hypothetical protein